MRALQPPAEPSPLWTAALLALVTLAARAALFPFNQNLFGDAAARTELAFEWAAQPHWISGAGDGARQFGPLHLYVVGAMSWIWREKEHVGRLASLVFGAGSAFPLFFLTRRLFGWRAGAWACLALCAWGLHVQMSTTAGSEALFLFLLLSATWQFAEGYLGNRTAPLVAAAALMNLAMATRYEGWLLAGLMGVLLVFRKGSRRIGPTLAFAAACAPFPLAWMAGNQLLHGDALHPITYIASFHRAYVQGELRALGPAMFYMQAIGFWPIVALLSLSPGVAVCGAAGLWRAARERPELRWMAWLVLAPTAYFTFRAAVLRDFVPLARFTAAQLALLLPFVQPGFDALLPGVRPRLRRAGAALALALAVSVPASIGAFTYQRQGKYEDWVRPLSPTSTNAPEVIRIAGYLARPEEAGRVALLDTCPGYDDVQIAFFSGRAASTFLHRRARTFAADAREVAPGIAVVHERGELLRTPGVELRGRILSFLGRELEEVPGFAPPFRVFRAP